MLEEMAKIAAFKIMTSPDTECNWEEMVVSWEDGENHPDLVLWEPFDHYRPDDLLEIFDMFVESHLNFADECKDLINQ